MIRAQGSKLYVFVDNERAGQIVFDEDRLYYLVTPLFLQKAAEATLEIREIGETCKKQHYLPADIILRIDLSKKMDMTDKINEEIIRMLEKI